MSTDIRWGILATGKIAHSFASDLLLLPGAEIAAVGSRRPDAAAEFAATYGATRSHGSYEDLVADPEVDVVYVASPHALHLEHARLALEAGKPVLCEKALTLNARDAEAMVALARERGLFLMEAMWMACHPVIRRLRDRFAAGDLGTPLEVIAGLGFRVDAPGTDRMLDPDLGGGALLDMGVYPLTLAQLFLGEPEEQRALASLSGTGIDLGVAISASYASGAVASLSASMVAQSPRTASIATDIGRIDFPPAFHHPEQVTWTPYDGRTELAPEVIAAPEDDPVIGTGLGNEAAEVMRCLRAGELESPLVPHEQTLALMRQMDRLREQIGVAYPSD